MNAKWIKSRYEKSDFIYIKRTIFILLCVIITLMYFNQYSTKYNVYCVILSTCCMFYFLGRTDFVKKRINENNLELTNYSKKIYKFHKIIIFIYIVLGTVFCTMCIYKMIRECYDIKIWLWYATILPILYSDSVYLSGITAFGEKNYLSGEFLIDYKDIDEIREIKSTSTIHGDIILVTLWKNGKEIGFDKLFIDEYHKLRLMVYQNSDASV